MYINVKRCIEERHSKLFFFSIVIENNFKSFNQNMIKYSMIKHDFAFRTTHSFSYAQSSSGLRGFTTGC